MPKKMKRPVGRPAKEMPEQIPDTPENVAKILMKSKPKKVWEYLQEEKGKTDETG